MASAYRYVSHYDSYPQVSDMPASSFPKDSALNTTRTEKDLIGHLDIPFNALYGIHTARALDNFTLSERQIAPSLIHAFGYVKEAAARTNHAQGAWAKDSAKANAIFQACQELARGQHDSAMVVDALQGGAGTSTNMNANEVIANRAIQILGGTLGDKTRVSPLEDINLHQSTNDAYPTALKIALITDLQRMTPKLKALIDAFSAKEKEFARTIKIGRTQLQDAVFITLGREMKAYAEVLRRDLSRFKTAEESLYTVNLGGTAIGTGITAPLSYIQAVVPKLAELSGLPLKQADDLVDNTQNVDAFIQVSSALKTCAANLIKITTDLRLLSSGPEAGFNEIILPARQAGSSIMPGKVNPVIPEAVIQIGIRLIGYDHQVTLAASMGILELNAFLPLVADCLTDGIQLLGAAADMLRSKCVEGIAFNETKSQCLKDSPIALLTALVPIVGYDRAVNLVHEAKAKNMSIRQAVLASGIMKEEAFEALLSPECVMRLGSPDQKS